MEVGVEDKNCFLPCLLPPGRIKLSIAEPGNADSEYHTFHFKQQKRVTSQDSSAIQPSPPSLFANLTIDLSLFLQYIQANAIILPLLQNSYVFQKDHSKVNNSRLHSNRNTKSNRSTKTAKYTIRQHDDDNPQGSASR